MRDKVLDIVLGRNGRAGFAKEWWNSYIYDITFGWEGQGSYRIEYLKLCMENEPEIPENKNYWIGKLDAFGIPHTYEIEVKEPEPERGQLRLF